MRPTAPPGAAAGASTSAAPQCRASDPPESEPGDLWAALGRPTLDASIPGGNSSPWKRAMSCLRSALGPGGPRIRSWRALWTRVQSAHPPPRTTWRALCRGASLADVRRPGHGGAGSGVSTWNVRWLIDPLTTTASSICSILFKRTLASQTSCVRDTHWLPLVNEPLVDKCVRFSIALSGSF